MRENRRHITEQAADWFIRLREKAVSRQDRDALIVWLLESPIHVHEYLAIAQLYGDLGDVDPNKEIDIESLLPAVKENSNVVPLENSTIEKIGVGANVSDGRTRLLFGIAAGIAVFAIALIGVFYQYGQAQHYATAVGEQRSIVLVDGSIIEMNTQSELAVQVDKETRRVHLIKGEAFFDVERDPERPFIVDTGDAQIKVLGTKFNIYKQENQTAVTVVDGKVTVMPSPENDDNASLEESTAKGVNAAVELSVGEQVQITPQRLPIEKVSVNVSKITAWQDRRLIFEAQSLESIVEEFNRYNTRHIEVRDVELAKIELSGVFQSNDPDSLIEFLQDIRNIKVITRSNGLRIIKPGKKAVL